MTGTGLDNGNGGSVHRPVDIFGAMRSEIGRLSERFETGWLSLPHAFGALAADNLRPDLDVHGNDKEITIEVDLPGIDEKDVAVTLGNGVLTIEGQPHTERQEKKESYSLSVRRYGAFERSIRLPDTIDGAKLEARSDKGVLKVTGPKRPEAVKAEQRIEIMKA